MIKTILLNLDGSPNDSSVLTVGAQLSRKFQAHLQGFHVSPDAVMLATKAAKIDMGTSLAIAEMMNSLEAASARHRQQAQRAFSEFCSKHEIAFCEEPGAPARVTAAWREKSGECVEEIIAQVRFHDCVVLSHRDGHEGLSSTAIGDIVLSAGRPVIVAPRKESATFGETIAIAWKNTADAARALITAMPLLTKAKKVILLSANEENATALECVECGDSTASYLRWHGLIVESRLVLPAGRTVPESVLETTRDVGADLLVMGGYGHNRLREVMFGGFTQHALENADIPVFLFH